jgi:hypothetical protein
MPDELPTTEAARFFVIVIGAVCFGAATLLYLHAGQDYLVGVCALVLVGTIYLTLGIFAKTSTCQSAALLLTFGLAPWS